MKSGIESILDRESSTCKASESRKGARKFHVAGVGEEKTLLCLICLSVWGPAN